MEKILNLITKSDLTPDLKMLNAVCGMDTVKLILKNLNGLNFYIPKLSHLDSLVIKYVRKYPKKKLKQIAREIGVSEPYLKNLVKKENAYDNV
ncbi:hypothetical protein ACFLSQ_11750 [Bacteroidota bacterium]